jgi:cold shock CspA family protein
MCSKGKIAKWNDDKGFGFIAPFDCGLQVFIHVKAFGNRDRRPEVGDVVTPTRGFSVNRFHGRLNKSVVIAPGTRKRDRGHAELIKHGWTIRYPRLLRKIYDQRLRDARLRRKSRLLGEISCARAF